jgi:hypothetical protein
MRALRVQITCWLALLPSAMFFRPSLLADEDPAHRLASAMMQLPERPDALQAAHNLLRKRGIVFHQQDARASSHNSPIGREPCHKLGTKTASATAWGQQWRLVPGQPKSTRSGR